MTKAKIYSLGLFVLCLIIGSQVVFAGGGFISGLNTELKAMIGLTREEKVTLMANLTNILTYEVQGEEIQELWNELEPQQIMVLFQRLNQAVEKGVKASVITGILQRNRSQVKEQNLKQLYEDLAEAIKDCDQDQDQLQDQLQEQDQDRDRDYEEKEPEHDGDPDQDQDQVQDKKQDGK